MLFNDVTSSHENCMTARYIPLALRHDAIPNKATSCFLLKLVQPSKR